LAAQRHITRTSFWLDHLDAHRFTFAFARATQGLARLKKPFFDLLPGCATSKGRAIQRTQLPRKTQMTEAIGTIRRYVDFQDLIGQGEQLRQIAPGLCTLFGRQEKKPLMRAPKTELILGEQHSW